MAIRCVILLQYVGKFASPHAQCIYMSTVLQQTILMVLTNLLNIKKIAGTIMKRF